MPSWPYAYCPLLLSLKERQGEDTLEGEIARAVYGDRGLLFVVAPVTARDVQEGGAYVAMPLPKHLWQLETFNPPGDKVWAEGQGEAAFAQAMPDGSVRVVRIDAGKNSDVHVDPLAVIRKPSGFRPERAAAGWGAERFDITKHDFAAETGRVLDWVEEHMEFAVIGSRPPGGPPRDERLARVERLRDFGIVVVGCMEPKVRPVDLGRSALL